MKHLVKKETWKLCNKLHIKVNVPIEFNSEKYNLNHKSHIFKSKTTNSYK